MIELERLNLIQSIKRDIRIKRSVKGGKIGVIFGSISLLTYITSFILMFFPSLASLAPLGGISMVSTIFFSAILACSCIEINFLEKYDSYKTFCESYTVLKNGKEKIYKVKTFEGNTIFLNENAIYNEENNLQEENKKLKKDIEELKEQLDRKHQLPTNSIDNKNKTFTYRVLTDDKLNYNPSVGRKKELDLLQETIIMTGVVNPLIIGPAGVGKTSLVRGLVYQIQNGNVCNYLKDRKIIEVSAADLVSGCRHVGDFEQKMMNFIDFAQKEKAIFFIDEFHAMIGLGQGANGNLDGANILKTYLSDGKIKIIGATTEEEYEKIIKNDSAFTRRFEVIRLTEPSGNLLYDIVNERVSRLEKNNNIKFGKNEIEKQSILRSLIELTEKNNKHRKYDCDINNPILILNIIIRSFAKAKINNSDVVTIQNVCDCLENNDNFYHTSIEKTLFDINNLDITKEEEESEKVKIIKYPNNRV